MMQSLPGRMMACVMLSVTLVRCGRSDEASVADSTVRTSETRTAVAVAPAHQTALCRPAGSPVAITSDSVGGLSLTAPLGVLKGRCPAASTTSYEGFETTLPALQFPFDSLTVVGFQHGEQLDLSQPADAWEARGCGGRLPRGVSTCATWREIVAAYGDSGSGSTEFGPATVRLRALPGISLELDVTDSTVGSLEVQPNLNRIPAAARLLRTVISSSAP